MCVCACASQLGQITLKCSQLLHTNYMAMFVISNITHLNQNQTFKILHLFCTHCNGRMILVLQIF